MHSVLVIEDYESDCARVQATLAEHPEFRTVGEAWGGVLGLQLACRLRPSIVVLGMGLPDIVGIKLLAPLRTLIPDVRLVMMSGSESFKYVRQAYWFGANGFVPKSELESDLIGALESVCEGRRFVSAPSVARALAELDAPREHSARWNRFSPLEKRVAWLGYLTLSASEIARFMEIDPVTVETCRADILRRECFSTLAVLDVFVGTQVEPEEPAIQSARLAGGLMAMVLMREMRA